jgi:hypothetical protein
MWYYTNTACAVPSGGLAPANMVHLRCLQRSIPKTIALSGFLPDLDMTVEDGRKLLSSGPGGLRSQPYEEEIKDFPTQVNSSCNRFLVRGFENRSTGRQTGERIPRVCKLQRIVGENYPVHFPVPRRKPLVKYLTDLFCLFFLSPVKQKRSLNGSDFRRKTINLKHLLKKDFTHYSGLRNRPRQHLGRKALCWRTRPPMLYPSTAVGALVRAKVQPRSTLAAKSRRVGFSQRNAQTAPQACLSLLRRVRAAIRAIYQRAMS